MYFTGSENNDHIPVHSCFEGERDPAKTGNDLVNVQPSPSLVKGVGGKLLPPVWSGCNSVSLPGSPLQGGRGVQVWVSVACCSPGWYIVAGRGHR